MLPDNVLSTTPVLSAFESPDSLERLSLTVDREMGGTALNNPTDGLLVQAWRAWLDGSDVRCATEAAAASGSPGTILFTAAGITELSLTFDQNMRPAVAFVASGVAKLWWYDSVAGGQTTTTFATVTSPFLTLDDKRPKQQGPSDILMFYVRSGVLYYRQQRDRFNVEYTLATVPLATRVWRLGMGRGLRLQIELTDNDGPEFIPDDITAAYSDLVTDTLYAAGSSAVSPMFRGDPMSGRWRSRLEVSPQSRGKGWLRVNGELGAGVRLRIYGDGALVHDVTITTRTPTRVPAGRWRRMEIDVESTVRCTTVTLADSAQELRET